MATGGRSSFFPVGSSPLISPPRQRPAGTLAAPTDDAMSSQQPQDQKQQQQQHQSSSPGLPSPSQLLSTRVCTGLKSGSNAGSIPRDAILGFTNARVLRDIEAVEAGINLEHFRFRGQDSVEGDGDGYGSSGKENREGSNGDSKQKKGKPPKVSKEPVKRRTKAVPDDGRKEIEGKPKPKQRQRKKKSEEVLDGEVDDSTKKAAPKPRQRKKPIQEGELVDTTTGPVKPKRKPRQKKNVIALEAAADFTVTEQTLPGTVVDSISGPILQNELSPSSHLHDGKTTGKRKRVSKVATDGEPKKPRKKAEKKSEASMAATTATNDEVQPALLQKERADPGAEDVSLAIDSAPRRRLSWTPVRELGPSKKLATEAEDDDSEARTSFSNLIGNFGYADTNTEVSTTMQQKLKAPQLSKRTTTDMKGPHVPVLKATTAQSMTKVTVEKPKKTKSPKKRLQTITALATEAYRPQVAVENDSQTSMADFVMRPASAATQLLEPGQAEEDTTETKKRSRKSTDGTEAPKKTSKTKKVKTKDVQPLYVLPTPEVAHQNLKAQDFLFGTSSQLAADQSPETFRQIQQVMKLSEEDMGSIYGSQRSPDRSPGKVASAPHGTHISIGQGTHDLWGKSARDADSIMFLGEPIPVVHDLAGNSIGLDTATFNAVGQADQIEQDLPQDELHDSGFVELSEHGGASPKKAVPSTTFDKHEVVEITSSSPPEPSPVVALPTPNDLPDKAEPPRLAALESVPLLPAVQKAEEKRPRGRPRKDAAASPAAHFKKKDVALDATTPTRRPVRRPRKSPVPSSSDPSSWLNIDEIMDSEAEATTPSPPRRRKTTSPPTSPPRTLQLSDSNGAIIQEQSTIDPPAQLDNLTTTLFPQIKRVLYAQPRSKDPKHPSWHEKMLLFDPIVLEDFTAWLNGQGVRVESAKQAKTKGMASKGKGKAKRAGGGDSAEQVVDREVVVPVVNEKAMEGLKPWIVQKWCEHYSVCCLYKEGLRGGVKKTY